MARKHLPRYGVLATTLVVIGITYMLTVFYVQYRGMANRIVSSGVEQHQASALSTFHNEAARHIDELVGELERSSESVDTLLALMLADARNAESRLVALRFKMPGDPAIQVGIIPETIGDSATSWSPTHLFLARPVTRGSDAPGVLTGSFELRNLHSAVDQYRNELVITEQRQSYLGFSWVAVSILIVLSLFITTIWILARHQNRRIRQLQNQIRKLSDSDFGEPIPITENDSLGELASVFNSMRDRLQQTTISRNYVDSVLANMNEAIIITTPDGIISRVNKATAKLLGYSEEELVGSDVEIIVDKKKGSRLESDTKSTAPRETLFLSKSGQSIPVSYTWSTMDGRGEGDRIYAAQNITERRKAEQRIRYLARIDALTKVPNRMQFQHLLQRAIARAGRARRSVSLLYVDIDHFKEINDTFGHLAGDAALEIVATRLGESLPPDTVIGRLAGDEFAVIIDRLDHGENDNVKDIIDKLARKLLDRLADPFFVQGHEVFMTASMGIAYFPTDAPDVIDLIRNADAALYHAKRNGGNVFSYYAPEMNEAAVERLMTKSKLRRAFERNELLVRYQPKYNIETGAVIGAEALVRWELPERGIILPADFIPIAEESNLIIEIGEWVLDRVCNDFRYWSQTVSSPGRVSVNLSLKQLRQPNFINRISSILRSYELSPTSLELEITETTLMEDPVRTIKILDELYALGLHMAIDDFGTGYSSLSALQQFPINTLKIDQSFVKNIAVNADDATIVGTIIHMGKNLNMDVVAEGVETEEQLNFLQTLQCTYVQGLLFGDPMSSDSYLNLLLSQAEGTDSHRALFA